MIRASKVLQRCDQLADISSLEEGIFRAYLTPEHKAANSLVAAWMQEAGMNTWQDAAGNQCGRYASHDENAPILILASHLDTVPNAGKYDGIIGVLAAIEVVSFLNSQKTYLPFHIDIIGFADEEGSRFGATLLGSRAVAGDWHESLWQKEDENGLTLDKAFREFGLSPEDISKASYQSNNVLAYWELHIEQGPVLENENLPVGIVSAIAGARRFTIDIQGMAGHAGTVPMALRQDALVAASKLILAAERIAKDYDVVATVGEIKAYPGAVNVIPGAVQLSLDIRSEDDAKRDAAFDAIQQFISELSGVTVAVTETHSAPAVGCDKRIQALFSRVIELQDIEPIIMPSGAGHDAMAMAALCPVAMLFMRCDKGISHNPLESVTEEDTLIALETLYAAILLQAELI